MQINFPFMSHSQRSSLESIEYQILQESQRIASVFKAVHIIILTANNQSDGNGEAAFTNGDLQFTKDPCALEIFKNIIKNYKFFKDIFNVDPFKENKVEALIHFGKHFYNLIWDGKKIICGDGDEMVFNPIWLQLDAMSNQLTRAYLEKCQYSLQHKNGQVTAVIESICDVFATLIRQYSLDQTVARADWLICPGLIKSTNGKKFALRSLVNPGHAFNNHPMLNTDPQVADFLSIRDPQTIPEGSEGTINSGILNKAFYLFACKLGGYSWVKAGKVWHEVIVNPAEPLVQNPFLSKEFNFIDFAKLTILKTIKIYGQASTETQALISSWKEVNVINSGNLSRFSPIINSGLTSPFLENLSLSFTPSLASEKSHFSSTSINGSQNGTLIPAYSASNYNSINPLNHSLHYTQYLLNLLVLSQLSGITNNASSNTLNYNQVQTGNQNTPNISKRKRRKKETQIKPSEAQSSYPISNNNINMQTEEKQISFQQQIQPTAKENRLNKKTKLEDEQQNIVPPYVLEAILSHNKKKEPDNMAQLKKNEEAIFLSNKIRAERNNSNNRGD